MLYFIVFVLTILYCSGIIAYVSIREQSDRQYSDFIDGIVDPEMFNSGKTVNSILKLTSLPFIFIFFIPIELYYRLHVNRKGDNNAN